MNISTEILNEWSKAGHRVAMGESMILVADEFKDVVTVNADITNTARMVNFEKKYPERLLNVGIAEQNSIAYSAGIAREGLIPYTVGLGAFTPMRCAEQMRVACGYMNMNVKVVAIESGVGFGPLGNTHFSMDDLAVVRAIPNFTVISPSDPMTIYKALRAAATYEGPVYLRMTGAGGFPVMYDNDCAFEIGKAIEYKKGTEVAIISTGAMLCEAVKAAEMLDAKGISTRVIDMHTIKPLDTAMLDDVFANNSLVVTVEEHTCMGGLGSAVAEYKATKANAPKQVFCSFPDAYLPVGNRDYILSECGLDANGIVKSVESAR